MEYCGIRGRVGLGLQEMQHERCAQAEALASEVEALRAQLEALQTSTDGMSAP